MDDKTTQPSALEQELREVEQELREAKIRSKRHYELKGSYAQVGRDGRIAIIRRRTINAPVDKYADAPKGTSAKRK